MVKWNHIMDKQPEYGEKIIHLDAPYEGYYSIGINTYALGCAFEEFLNCCKENDLPNPDFWWIYYKDFPFPDRHEEVEKKNEHNIQR